MNDALLKLYFFIEENPATAITVLLEIVALGYLVYRSHKRKEYRKKVDQQKKNIQLQELVHNLSNPLWIERTGKPDTKLEPYETKWLNSAGVISSGIVAELNVKNENVNRKYLLVIDDDITIGRDGSCSITIEDHAISGRHIQLINEKNALYIKRLSKEGTTILERGRDYKKIDDKKFRVLNGDVIRLGHSDITITLKNEAAS
ncbi:MAG: FHA domain-containing protein [Butyrivibrio sp.]|nr:FHA domain-containing protein [Butyrivibrio sp.]